LRVFAIVRDLILASRIEEASRRGGAILHRVDSPTDLPPADELDLVLVDWADRQPGWGEALTRWRGSRDEPRLILFGPHTDLSAHAEARRAGLAPMWARSRLVRELPAVLGVSAERS
jgi:hypothetical protein